MHLKLIGAECSVVRFGCSSGSIRRRRRRRRISRQEIRARANAIESAERLQMLLQLQPCVRCRRMSKQCGLEVETHLQMWRACRRRPAIGRTCPLLHNNAHARARKAPPTVALHGLHHIVQLRNGFGEVGHSLVGIALE